MKVVCDNCRAVYKIPNDKLVKPINKATCRNCGYRMLIPRPPATGDSEFSTLVTAVPPTPIGAPPREESGLSVPEEELPGGDSTEIIQQGSDKTSPGGLRKEEVPLYESTPVHIERIKEPLAPSQPDDSFLGSEDDTRVTELSNFPLRTGDTVKASSPLSRPPARRHDPSTDLTIAALGVLAAMLGTFPMAALAFFPNPVLLWIGQSIAFGGATTALLIILTSSRGRRPASRVLSLFAGGSLALFIASVTTAGQYLSEHEINWMPQTSNSNAGIIAEPIADEAPDAPPEDALAEEEGEEEGEEEPLEEDEEANKEAEDDQPEAVKSPASPPTVSRKTPSSSGSTRSARSNPVAPSTDDELDAIIGNPSPKTGDDDWGDEEDGELDLEDEMLLDDDPLAAPAPAPAPRPAPAPKSDGQMTTVPMEVVDVMLRNNMDVKKCFYYYAQSHGGQLPPRLDLKFTLQTTGRASNLSIKQAEHAKSEVEQCLRTAVGSISFPPAGKAQKLTYPFVLQ